MYCIGVTQTVTHILFAVDEIATESTMTQQFDTGLVSIALQLMAIGYPCLHYWSGTIFFAKYRLANGAT